MMIDLHTHILPNVDDGAVSLEDALHMAQLALESGVYQIVATPHYNCANSATYEEIEHSYMVLCDALEYEQLPLKLLLGMEIFADDDLPRKLVKKEVRTYPNSKYFLVEFDMDESVDYFERILEQCVEEGFLPVIAHPERYDAVWESPEIANDWCKKGYGVQVNRDSLLGKFGQRAYECADYLVKHGWANCIASDAHAPYMRSTYWRESLQFLLRTYGQRNMMLYLKNNPERILQGKSILPIRSSEE